MNGLTDQLRSNKRLWEIFTRKEEYEPKHLDQYGRFPYSASGYSDVLTPIVSDYLLAKGLQVEYPEGRKFAICLTHDVDFLYRSRKTLIYTAFQSLSQKHVTDALRRIKGSFSRKHTPLWNMPQIMKIEDKFEAQSSFFFLAQKEQHFDFRYKINEFQARLGEIVDKGWEVGLHGGFDAFDNLEILNEEKNRLEKVLGKQVIGYRNHYLRFKVPKTWEMLELAGFGYDVTLGFPETIGFRNGMCHPFYPFNLETNQYHSILEIPLGIMDGSLFQYMGLDMIEAWKLTKAIIDVIEERQGAVNLLWHNTSMFGAMRKFYEKVLAYCYEKKAWLTSGEKLLNWWEKNKFLNPR